MTITISLPPETERKLSDLAAANGQDVVGYVRQLIEKTVQETKGNGETATPPPSTNKTFDQIFAPFEGAIEKSGLTDDELEALFHQARDEVWQEKRAQGNKAP